MATSGEYTWTPSSYGPGVGYPNRAKIVWSATWNLASLQWTVTWNATAQGASTAGRWTTVYGSNNNCNSYITVTDENGNVLQTKTIVARMDTVKNDTVLLEGTFNVGVTSLGTRSLTFAGQIYFETTGSAGISSGSQAFALDTVALASSISSLTQNVSVGSSGGTSTVNISRNSSAYTHTVKWTFGSNTYSATNVGTSASYTIPASWLSAIPNSATGTGTVTVTTYYNGTQIGSATSANFTVTANVYPSVGAFTVAPRGTAYNAGMTSVYIAGYSTALLSASSVAGVNGSSISKYEFIKDGSVLATYTSSATSYSHTTGTLTGSSATFSVRVTDSRGKQTTKAASAITIQAYATPTFTETTVYRCNSSGTADEAGTYCFIRASAVATPSANSITALSFAVKATTQSTYGSEITLTNGSYNISSGYSNTSSYNIRITATDKLGGKSYYYTTIPTQAFTMDFKVGGKGVAFGKVAETNNLVDSAWDIKTSGTIKTTADAHIGATGSPTVMLECPIGTRWGDVAVRTNAVNGVQLPVDMALRLWSYNSSTGARTGYYDQYVLPSVTPDRSSNFGYSILTTKLDEYRQNAQNTNFSPAAAHTWYEVPNCSITIPTNGLWAVRAFATYNNAQPTGIAISIITDGSQSYTNWSAITDRSLISNSGTTQYLRASYVGELSAQMVIKVWARYGSSSSGNSVGLRAYLLTPVA